MRTRPRRRKNKLILGLLLFCASISLLTLQRIYKTGAFKTLQSHSPSCLPLTGAVGVEDIAISQDGFAYLSSQDRRAAIYQQSWEQGAILGLSLPASSPPQALSSDFSQDFHPRGLSLYEDASESRLLVINYRPDRFTIEIFSATKEELVHRQTLESPLLNEPHSIAATGPDSFYVTNERGLYTPTGHFIEDFFQLKTSTILYYDGNSFKVVGKKLARATGLLVQQDRVLVAEMLGQSLGIFLRQAATGELELQGKLPLQTFPNKIKADSKGSLWIAAHPQLLHLQSHSLDPAKVTAPSQVLKLSPSEEAGFTPQEALLMVNGPFSAASVAAPFQNHLLLGVAFEDKLLICQAESQELAQ